MIVHHKGGNPKDIDKEKGMDELRDVIGFLNNDRKKGKSKSSVGGMKGILCIA